MFLLVSFRIATSKKIFLFISNIFIISPVLFPHLSFIYLKFHRAKIFIFLLYCHLFSLLKINVPAVFQCKFQMIIIVDFKKNLSLKFNGTYKVKRKEKLAEER